MSFRPTCPRCQVVGATDARYCTECGTRLYPTDEELLAMVEELKERAVLVRDGE